MRYDPNDLNRDVNELELSVRTLNVLMNANIRTVGDLVRKDEGDLRVLRNFGQKSMQEVKEVLESFALSLGMQLKGSYERPYDEVRLSIYADEEKQGEARNASLAYRFADHVYGATNREVTIRYHGRVVWTCNQTWNMDYTTRKIREICADIDCAERLEEERKEKMT